MRRHDGANLPLIPGEPLERVLEGLQTARLNLFAMIGAKDGFEPGAAVAPRREMAEARNGAGG
jgi:hypothetical protein